MRKALRRTMTAMATVLALAGPGLAMAQDAAQPAPLPQWQRTAPAGAPNVVLVLLDDVGFGATSTFGGVAQTPALDPETRVEATRRQPEFHRSGAERPALAVAAEHPDPQLEPRPPPELGVELAAARESRDQPGPQPAADRRHRAEPRQPPRWLHGPPPGLQRRSFAVAGRQRSRARRRWVDHLVPERAQHRRVDRHGDRQAEDRVEIAAPGRTVVEGAFDPPRRGRHRDRGRVGDEGVAADLDVDPELDLVASEPGRHVLGERLRRQAGRAWHHPQDRRDRAAIRRRRAPGRRVRHRQRRPRARRRRG